MSDVDHAFDSLKNSFEALKQGLYMNLFHLLSEPRDAFEAFRTKVKQYDYPNCHAWCETRCGYVLENLFIRTAILMISPAVTAIGILVS